VQKKALLKHSNELIKLEEFKFLRCIGKGGSSEVFLGINC